TRRSTVPEVLPATCSAFAVADRDAEAHEPAIERLAADPEDARGLALVALAGLHDAQNVPALHLLERSELMRGVPGDEHVPGAVVADLGGQVLDHDPIGAGERDHSLHA